MRPEDKASFLILFLLINSYLHPFPGSPPDYSALMYIFKIMCTEMILPSSFRYWLGFQTKGTVFLRRKEIKVKIALSF